MHRGQVSPSAIRLALDGDRDYNVPMAPELGLFLVRKQWVCMVMQHVSMRAACVMSITRVQQINT